VAGIIEEANEDAGLEAVAFVVDPESSKRLVPPAARSTITGVMPST
jgi:hypothetical protein